MSVLRILVALSLLLVPSLRAGLQPIEVGEEIRQVTSDENDLYALGASGRVYRRSLGGGPVQQVDDGTGTRMLAASRGVLYLLKESGWIFQRRQGTWRQIDDGSQTRMITASGGRMYVLKESGQVWCYDGQGFGGGPVVEKVGVRSIHARGATLWILQENGVLLRQRGQQLEVVAPEIPGIREIALGSAGTYLVAGNGSLYRYRGGQAELLREGAPCRQLTHGDDLYTLEQGAEIWHYQSFFGRWTRLEGLGPLRQIHAVGARLLMVRQDGSLWCRERSPWGEARNQERSRNFQALHAVD